MKRACFFLIMFCLVLRPCLASDQAPPASDYKANTRRTSTPPLGYGSSTATDHGISMSMMGWGLGITVVIIALTTLIHQSTFAHGEAPQTNTDTKKK